MNVYPTEPRPGERVRASTLVDIIRCLRRITPLGGPGVRMRVTPNGTHIEVEAKRSVGSARSNMPGCWSILEIDGDVVTFWKCYINCAGKTYDVGEDEVEDESDGGDADDGDSGETETDAEKSLSITLDGAGIVAAVYDTTLSTPVSNTSLIQFETLSDLQTYQSQHTDKMCIPLYRFAGDSDSGYSVSCDFRNCPTAVQAEF